MSAESSAYSLTSDFSSASLGASVGSGRAQRAARAAASDDAVLSIREECRRLQARDKERDAKLKQLAAQLARTEEAAKRILVRECPEARQGWAQQMLDAERQLDAARAEVARLDKAVKNTRRAAAQYKQHAEELKAQLRTCQTSQRQLVVQVGLLQAKLEAARGRGRI